MAGHRIAPVLAAALLGGAARPAAAQPAQPGEVEIDIADPPASDAADAPARRDPRLARKWLAAAQQLMQRGGSLAARNRGDEARAQFENAVIAYQRAIEASGDPNLYLDLAIAEDRLDRLEDVVKHLRRVAGEGVRPEIARRAAAQLDSVVARIGIVTLRVVPAGASITLGGTEVGTAPLAEPLVLLPGTYTLAFAAPGHQRHEEEITVDAGAEIERTIALAPIAAPVAPRPAVARPAAAPAQPRRLPLYVGAGVTGAAVLGTAVFGVLALAEHATFTRASTSPAARDGARSSGQRFALIADVSLGAAAIAGAVTAYWYFIEYPRSRSSDDRRPPQAHAKLDVVPWVQSRSGGAAVAGSF